MEGKKEYRDREGAEVRKTRQEFGTAWCEMGWMK